MAKLKNKNMKKNTEKIGIMGVGMVGGALKRFFDELHVPLYVYDKYKKLGSVEEVNKADVVFICVPTPYDRKKGFLLTHVSEAIRSLCGEKIVVIKSTVIPGTTESFQKKYPQHSFLFNPEFLVEATAYENMVHPDRQIVGYTEKSKNLSEKILSFLPKAPFVSIISSTEAEMVKYTNNTFLATKVIFANQIYDLCKSLHINYDNIKECVAADPRIGKSHMDVAHRGYRGYGGKCFPKDMKAFIQFAKTKKVDLKLHKLVDGINEKLLKEQKIKNSEEV